MRVKFVFKLRRFFVHLLVCLFGCGTWITLTGVWVELPIMVDYLPESWDLGAYLTVVIQLGNVGPLLYLLGKLLAPTLVSEKLTVYTIVVIESISCVLLAVFWKETSQIAGVPHSTALFLLQFFCAVGCCTSSLVFLPFMYLLQPSYLTSFYIGQGLSGFLPSVVALAQGIRKVSCENVTQPYSGAGNFSLTPIYGDPNFPPEVFFFLLLSMIVLCGISFTLLNYLPLCKKEHIYPNDSSFSCDRSPSETTPLTKPLPDDKASYSVKWDKVLYKDSVVISNSVEKLLTRAQLTCIMLTMGWIKALENGVIPSVQTYAYLPYGMEPYTLAVDLAYITDPTMCFLATFLPTRTTRPLVFCLVLGTLLAGYTLALASLSPSPYLVDQPLGRALAVVSQVLVTSCLTYTKVSVAALCRKAGKTALFWCGVATQAGAFTGAVVMFVLVSVLEVFQKAPTCPS